MVDSTLKQSKLTLSEYTKKRMMRISSARRIISSTMKNCRTNRKSLFQQLLCRNQWLKLYSDILQTHVVKQKMKTDGVLQLEIKIYSNNKKHKCLKLDFSQQLQTENQGERKLTIIMSERCNNVRIYIHTFNILHNFLLGGRHKKHIKMHSKAKLIIKNEPPKLWVTLSE